MTLRPPPIPRSPIDSYRTSSYAWFMLVQAFDLADYAFSAFAVPSFLTTLAILGLGVLVLVRERISLVSVSFFLLTLAVSVWLFSFSCVYLSTNEHTALGWMKVAYLG